MIPPNRCEVKDWGLSELPGDRGVVDVQGREAVVPSAKESSVEPKVQRSNFRHRQCEVQDWFSGGEQSDEPVGASVPHTYFPRTQCEVRDWYDGSNVPVPAAPPSAPSAPTTPKTEKAHRQDDDCTGHRPSASNDGKSSSRLLAKLSDLSIGGVFGRTAMQASLEPPTEDEFLRKIERQRERQQPTQPSEPERKSAPQPAVSPSEPPKPRYPGLRPPPM